MIPQPLQHRWPWCQKLKALWCMDRCQGRHGSMWGKVWLTPAYLLQVARSVIPHADIASFLPCSTCFSSGWAVTLFLGPETSDTWCWVQTKTYSGPHIKVCALIDTHSSTSVISQCLIALIPDSVSHGIYCIDLAFQPCFSFFSSKMTAKIIQTWFTSKLNGCCVNASTCSMCVILSVWV